MLFYCKKCGRIASGFGDETETDCDYCMSSMYQIPEDYLEDGLFIKHELEDQFVEEFIKSSPEFDEQMYQGMKQYVDNRDYGESLRAKENGNVPKCPTCSSTKITKISTTSKVAGAAMFGLFSKTARSQFKCNSCGYKW